MKSNALSVANYFVELSLRDSAPLRPLKLMKLVYIAYGFGLAILRRNILDPRFDSVEAWKLGPVIPSVYHSFKQYGKAPITAKTTMFVFSESGDYSIVTPELTDSKVKEDCDFVWARYGSQTDSQLVALLHKNGTPWANVYLEGQNRIIPTDETRCYYRELANYLING